MLYITQQSMFKLIRSFSRFSTKSSDFFWQQVNPGVKNVRYAVRGIVPTMADNIKEELKKGDHNYPFDQVTYCNIGNPQEFNQKPITFFREVLACVANPSLIEEPSMNPDAQVRAKRILDEIVSCGAYTQSLGITSIRENVAKFIAKSDNVPKPPIEHIFMTDGASQGIFLLFSSIIANRNDSILVPIPIYPLYTATISLYGGAPAPYYLDENHGWEFSHEQLERALEKSRNKGHTVKAIVVINPSNPTGSVLSVDTIKKMIEFSVQNRLVIVADEVYRDNIYDKNTQFHSFREVLETMPPEYRDKCQLATTHSTSKGLLGQAGIRAGYFYFHNFSPFVVEQLAKLKTVNLCSNTLGQIAVDLMVNPPLDGVSKTTKKQYQDEIKAIYKSLKERAKIVTKALNQMQNIKCNPITGAMYAFPQIKFSKNAIAAAQKEGKPVDQFYCIQVLRNTGIALIAGSGFSQYPGTYHFRITILVRPEEKLKKKLAALKQFNKQFHAKYAD